MRSIYGHSRDQRRPQRRAPFSYKKTTTSKSVGYVVIFQLSKNSTPRLLRISNGCASWAGPSESGTIFKSKANATKTIEAIRGRWVNSTLRFTIVSVGEAEHYPI